MRSVRNPANQHGYSLIEVSVVIGVLGVLTFATTTGMENIQRFREQRAAIANAETARNAIREFAMRNKRLPCPAASNSVREPTGVCNNATGWLPYESVGLAAPVERNRIKYGVYLSSTVNLASPARVSDDNDLGGTGDFIVALRQAAAASANIKTPYYAHDAIAGGAVSCAATNVANPAFLVVSPASDLGGKGAFFEAPNDAFGAAGTCASSPARQQDSNVDDVVVAESTTALLGWISNANR